MYLRHFALTRLPFETPAHTDELFDSGSRREAQARLQHLIELRGIGLLTGEVSVLTVTDGRAIGLFDGIESLTEVMPDRVPHGRHRVRAHRCGRSGEAWRCTPRRAAMAVSKLTAPWRSLDEVRRWRPGA